MDIFQNEINEIFFFEIADAQQTAFGIKFGYN